MRDKLWGVYPNLERWILLNCRSVAEFARRVSVDARTMRRILSAECGTTKSVIDRILKVTGMTYEKCFKEEQ